MRPSPVVRIESIGVVLRQSTVVGFVIAEHNTFVRSAVQPIMWKSVAHGTRFALNGFHHWFAQGHAQFRASCALMGVIPTGSIIVRNHSTKSSYPRRSGIF